MASETKRQNAGNKVPVALPNSVAPPSPTVSPETVLSGVMGARVRVTTSAPTSATYEGLLYTADPITNLLVLSIPPSSSSAPTAAASNSNPTSNSTSSSTPPTNTFKILPIRTLTSCTVLSTPSNPIPTPNNNNTLSKPNPSLPQPTYLDIPSLTTRTNSTVAALKAQDAKRGRGVTREAQDIFDGISRTYQARWHGTAMVVNENVIIEHPYHVDDCRLVGGSAEQGLLRIQKVLGMEREKLALRRGLGSGGIGLGLGVGRARGGGGGGGLSNMGGGLGERKGG
ncbi:hypothetical protein EPUS_01765 [Endocarpon pusillum Z07020]|uniref:AD domain-containing protein n=1 Tax=Endocarpon pusillum (strain Z07020 / HMAS-L-300199) TaxID=1263415 RepID=U1HNB9_ENDPU|nr:uncharacterized protein EPUS_01765 [Endocarpon pusillum Z07020]ERF71850.1 hypothetical protein EPUS_01765 [Endocarpon pusillum Z07020]